MLVVQPLGAGLCRNHHPLSSPTPSQYALKPWRTNLTGLSNTHNLYFVAHASEIIVYEPRFPAQDLSSSFSLVVSTPPSVRGLQGHIDPRNPHAINNLVVDYLGSEEILAVVRDDGDVDAYLTKHISAAIERRRCALNSLSVVAAEIRPLLHRNVGNSAWGLAIHTEGRLIAVSSNNHEFNIFKFGLADHTGDESVNVSSECSQFSDREQDEHIRLPNGGANIPCIAFCNSGHDPDGRYLLTTDISGLTRWWDLRSRAGPQGMYTGRSPRQTSAFSEDCAGWGVAFLDPRAFAEVDDFHGAAFPAAAKNAADLKYDSAVWDLTAARLGLSAAGDAHATSMTSIPLPNGDRQGSTPRRSSSHGLGERQSTRRISQHDNGTPSNDDNEDDDLVEETIVERIRKVVLRVGDNGSNSTIGSEDSSEQDDNDDDNDDDMQDIMDEDEEDIDDDNNRVPLDTRDEPAHTINTTTTNTTQPPPLDPDGPDLVPFNTPARNPRSRLRIRRELAILRRLYADQYPIPHSPSLSPAEQNYHLLFANDTAMCPGLPCPIFTASVRDMHLLQPATSPSPTAIDHLPLILIANAFKTPLSADADDFAFGTDFFERCSLLAQIPSLGVLVVGNQKGKVAVLSGFKTRERIDIKGPAGTRVKGVKWVYGLRLQAMVPFRRQEREGLKPACQLYGLAVGRMQGCLRGDGEGPGEERWRLMVMWIDETVLSYEIRREEKGGLGVEGLVI
ncbi:hypothetical protein KVT40_006070 [Elsinoe batatas]|uniref:Uncharacterized protein n=1 Tax=Elsinoe batatas TaxID=2601811 RepID=A0A8K0KXA2_9PEZI|nr:hypothetical protein KVT40_006070 [Elsinoe batatas]